MVSRARAGTVKIVGIAPSCRQELEGSGFVVSPERVATNAHVVAGTRRLTVESESGEQLTARVVLFDYNNDVAVLDVPGLTAPALCLRRQAGTHRRRRHLAGLPGGGPFTATPVRVRNVIRLSGPNIYSSQQVRREVYTVRGQIRQGNSGGPLINSAGEVLGVVFGASEDPPTKPVSFSPPTRSTTTWKPRPTARRGSARAAASATDHRDQLPMKFSSCRVTASGCSWWAK